MDKKQEPSIEEIIIPHLEQAKKMLANREQENLSQLLSEVIDLLQDHKAQIEHGALRNTAYADLLFRYLPCFVTPIIITGEGEIHNGTCFFVELEDKCIAITNHHVVQFWRDLRKEGKPAGFQIGDLIHKENLEELILGDSDLLDLATILITRDIKEELTQKGKQFFRYHHTRNAEVGDRVFALGWPGVLREDEHDEYQSTSYFVAIQGEVMDATDRKLVVSIARENWDKRMGERELEELTEFGGMSGGPIFLFVDGVLHLVGVIFQDLGKGGLWGEGLQAVHAHFINPDGSIEEL
ncbi:MULTISPECIES: trypsin-like peptidase domain-containing protein [Paenibacillus]|uniref:trypsin-like peptidase domain-containing protein n=1 Tax=Paenibacillus TaxID=44249 RepID=UPI00096F2447|nr:trypsin-like peptidase domain-containing protein [Paenibacillus odorifer]OME13979.1 hypothetical protein BSK60_14085 [Paenibacillus odorifer]